MILNANCAEPVRVNMGISLSVVTDQTVMAP